MNTVLILFIIISIGYTVLWIFGKVFRGKKPAKPQEIEHVNPYVYYHARKIQDDKDYEEYLNFCAMAGEAPIDKVGFEAARKADKEIKSLLK